MGMCVLAAMVATPAMGIPVGAVFWEDWESEIPGTRLGDTAQWEGGNTSSVVVDTGGNNVGRLIGDPDTSDFLWTNANFGAGTQGKYQAFNYTAFGGGPGVGNRTHICVLDSGGGVWGRWYGDSLRLIPRLGGAVGPSVDISDGLPHEMTITYDPTTGVMDFWADSDPVWSTNAGTGNYMTRIEIQNQWGSASDWIDIDDIGIFPEPASLALLGIGLLFLKRRR